MFSIVSRIRGILSPPQPAKQNDALRIGLLGASNIAPMAVIGPAKSHPEVIVAAVAARDGKKANAYAKKHGIPIVHTSYQELIDDPSIDIIYVPLPNGLHYEWALKALKAKKHVLLEKPSTSNAIEAASLFRHELLSQPNAPILLEAFHARFHPAFQTFLSLLDKPNVAHATTINLLPPGLFGDDDIRFQYKLAGGLLMDLGAYNVMILRQIFGAEPEECLEATPRIHPDPAETNIDQAFNIKWKFPNGGFGDLKIDFLQSFFSILSMKWPTAEVVHKIEVIEDSTLPSSQEHVSEKTVTFWNFLMPTFWHRIDVVVEHTIRNVDGKRVIKTWKETSHHKAYTWSKETKKPGEEWWMTYRYQLEEFVNRIKGREGSGVWMDGEDSIRQMEMIDSGYKKAGLPLRPTSTYF